MEKVIDNERLKEAKAILTNKDGHYNKARRALLDEEGIDISYGEIEPKEREYIEAIAAREKGANSNVDGIKEYYRKGIHIPFTYHNIKKSIRVFGIDSNPEDKYSDGKVYFVTVIDPYGYGKPRGYKKIESAIKAVKKTVEEEIEREYKKIQSKKKLEVRYSNLKNFITEHLGRARRGSSVISLENLSYETNHPLSRESGVWPENEKEKEEYKSAEGKYLKRNIIYVNAIFNEKDEVTKIALPQLNGYGLSTIFVNVENYHKIMEILKDEVIV